MAMVSRMDYELKDSSRLALLLPQDFKLLEHGSLCQKLVLSQNT